MSLHQTSRETNGEAVVFETFVEPHGFVAAAHVHPKQVERSPDAADEPTRARTEDAGLA